MAEHNVVFLLLERKLNGRSALTGAPAMGSGGRSGATYQIQTPDHKKTYILITLRTRSCLNILQDEPDTKCLICISIKILGGL